MPQEEYSTKISPLQPCLTSATINHTIGVVDNYCGHRISLPCLGVCLPSGSHLSNYTKWCWNTITYVKNNCLYSYYSLDSWICANIRNHYPQPPTFWPKWPYGNVVGSVDTCCGWLGNRYSTSSISSSRLGASYLMAPLGSWFTDDCRLKYYCRRNNHRPHPLDLKIKYNFLMQETAKKLIKQYVEGWKKNDSIQIVGCLTHNCVIIESHGPIYTGIKGVKKWVDLWVADRAQVS